MNLFYIKDGHDEVVIKVDENGSGKSALWHRRVQDLINDGYSLDRSRLPVTFSVEKRMDDR